MNSASRWWLSLVFLVALPCGAATEPVKDKVADSLPALQAQLQSILNEMHVPGVSVAIVRKEGPEWVGAVGLANVERNEPATADTMFRIGSTSKAFTALALLQLVEQGKVSLEDPVSRYVTDIPYENPWEATDPVLIADLLEHTAGWDDLKLREFAQQAKGWTLQQGMTFDTGSHRSRWRPGTRMSYANGGTTMAAAVVEKVTGQTLETYVAAQLFTPIGMRTATYFEPAGLHATTLYHQDGKTPFPYWHIIVRPSGSINASAKDMAAYLAFYLSRGKAGEQAVVSSASVDRMEVPTRSWAAKEGVSIGYGLHNYSTVADGFVVHGHNGGVSGGLTAMAYVPSAGVGYFMSINADNGAAFQRLENVIRRYALRGLTPPVQPPAQILPAFANNYVGWYQPDSPRNEMFRFLERLMGLTRLEVQGNVLVMSPLLGGEQQHYVSAGGRTLRRTDTGHAEPVATLALLTPQPDGLFIGSGGAAGTMRQLPTWIVMAELLGMAWFALAIAAIVLYAPFWLVGRWVRGPRPVDRTLRVAGLLPVLSLLGAVAFVALGTGDVLTNFGAASVFSIGLCVATWLLAASTLAFVYLAFFGSSNAARSVVRWHGRFCAVGLLLGVAYLGYWGIIGVQSWA
jgi:CubicO group peptidase (beta-lactamase class C family)